jgi:hypothetical protein
MGKELMQLCDDKWPIVILAAVLLVGCASQPVVEALMLNTSGTQGLSFTSPGRVIKQLK